MPENTNPLRRYFRQPAIHIRLPSQGNYYPPGALDMPPNGEIPILPMTALDEITTRTPDALFNGSAVAEIIHSCVPNIRDPWVVPVMDLNSLLVSIRLASYGHDMEIGSKCPACGHEHSLTIDLRQVLDRFQTPDYSKTVTYGDLTFYFAPLNYRQVNENSRLQYEDQKIIQMVNDADMSEDQKMKTLGDAFRKITELTVKAISSSIGAIKTADTLVTEKEHIEDFLHNCPKAVFDQIRDHAVSLREASDIRPVRVVCEECKHEYEQPFTLDMSNFFDNAS